MTWVPLSQAAGGLQAFKLIIPAGFPATGPLQRSHAGYEWLYVLDGRLHLLLGEHDMLLTPGEVAEFDTHTPHAFTNPTDTPIRTAHPDQRPRPTRPRSSPTHPKQDLNRPTAIAA